MVIGKTEHDWIHQANEKLNVSLIETEKDFRLLTQERGFLHELVNNGNQTENFFDKDSGKYFYELRTCINSLLSLNVAASNVSSVIKSVLNLVDKQVDKLPSRKTILNMNIERLVLSKKQLNEKLPNQEIITLYTDETTKFGTKYLGYHVSDTQANTNAQ